MEKTTSIQAEHRLSFTECGWEDVTVPGAYVEKDSGDLFRIPREALVHGNSPIISKQSRGPSRFILISKDPYVITEKARMLSAEANVSPNF